MVETVIDRANASLGDTFSRGQFINRVTELGGEVIAVEVQQRDIPSNELTNLFIIDPSSRPPAVLVIPDVGERYPHVSAIAGRGVTLADKPVPDECNVLLEQQLLEAPSELKKKIVTEYYNTQSGWNLLAVALFSPES